MKRQSWSGLSLLWRSLGRHQGWREQWRKPEPKPAYDAVIIGGGGHGLGTAYYLAAEHGLTSVAVVEKGWIGGGNTGRNTTIIRSNYLFDESIAIYDHAVKLWEALAQELNYNVMYSPRGVMMLAHTVHDAQMLKRILHANRANGVETSGCRRKKQRPSVRRSTSAPTSAIPCWARRCNAAAARRDTTRWPGGMRVRPTRTASTSSRTARSRASAVTRVARSEALETTRGLIRTRKVGVVAAGNSSVVMRMAGVRLPLESFPLQAMVSEPVKPVFPCVVMSNAIHAYISQSDKGELVIGAGTDAYTSYTQRGALHVDMHTLEAICELFPCFRRLRMLRNWGGIVDVTPDRSPIIGTTPVPGLFVNCGWGTGGFKATPGSAHVFAWTLAKGEPHPIAAPFSLERFRDGRLIDEAAARRRCALTCC